MMIHWMMNNPWPSFFGHLFDDYFLQGGGDFGAKKGLRPINLVRDYCATGDRRRAKLYVVNHASKTLAHLRVEVGLFNPDGARRFFTEISNFTIAANTSLEAMTVPRVPHVDPTYLVRASLLDANENAVAENVYWESDTDDDLGDAGNDQQFKTRTAKWADLSALNTMPQGDVEVSTRVSKSAREETVTITLANSGSHVAFVLRAGVTHGADGPEVLPITYSDNYITVFRHETRTLVAKFSRQLLNGQPPGLRVEGYNVEKRIVPFR